MENNVTQLQYTRDQRYKCIIWHVTKRFPLRIYIVGTVIAWAIVFFVVSQLRPAKLIDAFSVGTGFYLGLLAMYIAMHVYRTDLDK